MTTVAANEAIFLAIADANRRRMLDLLAAGDSPAQDLAARFDISFAAVSQHLKVLREAGLVSRRADGRRRIYRLTPAKLRVVENWWQGRLKRLGEYLDAKK